MTTNLATSSAGLYRSLIEIDRLSKDYQAGEVKVQALRGISVHVSRGEFVAIMGVAGSGKSALLNILGCLEKPTKGTYILEGIDIGKSSRDDLAYIRTRYVGIVSQDFNHLSGITALEYVGLPMFYSFARTDLWGMKAVEALRKVGLDTMMYCRLNHLSRGQQQRVAIARAAANDPSIILVDEPTHQLDSRTSVEVMGVLRELTDRGTTVILATKEPDIASFATRQIAFREGMIVSDGTNDSPRRASEVLIKMSQADMERGVAA